MDIDVMQEFLYTWQGYWECCFYGVGFGADGDVVL